MCQYHDEVYNSHSMIVRVQVILDRIVVLLQKVFGLS